MTERPTRARRVLTDDRTPDPAMIAFGVVLVAALLGCVLLFVIAG
jgi:hypothetical protein